MAEQKHHYLIAFAALAIATSSMAYLDYTQGQLPLQASLLDSNNFNQNSPLSKTLSEAEGTMAGNSPSIKSTFTQQAPPTTQTSFIPSPSILPELFTENNINILNIRLSKTFFRYINTSEEIQPIIAYTIELTDLWEEDSKYINVFEIQAGTSSEAFQQEQYLLQLGTLQGKDIYEVSPTNTNEFSLIPTNYKNNLSFQAIQIGNKVYGFESSQKLYERVVFHLINKLKKI